jgi:hypothetical protein
MSWNGIVGTKTELLKLINAALWRSPWKQHVAEDVIQVAYSPGPARIHVTKPRFPDLVNAVVVSEFDAVQLQDCREERSDQRFSLGIRGSTTPGDRTSGIRTGRTTGTDDNGSRYT